ncbi:MAG: hypothetical protein EOP10_26335 [Proteobacteria bacterium]|nr:MAG: hypothetical protein EOP10_26335 [Pseudomonadota bacterium]
MPDKNEASEFLVGFLSNFTLLIERELLSIRQSVVLTVESVMEGIETISKTVEKNHEDAEELMEFTYLHPDAETEILLEDMQMLADELIEGVYREVSNKSSDGEDKISPESLTTSQPEIVVQNRFNRFHVKTDQSLGKLNQLDDSVSTSVLNIVGALSAEDLIAQRLEHTILSLKSLQTGLSFLLIDFSERCQPDEVQRVTKSILTYTFRQYTTEEEKVRFWTIFGKSAA